MAEDKLRKLTLKEMSEKRMLPSPIPNQLAYLSGFLDSYDRLREELEAGRISEAEAEKEQRKCFKGYSGLRARTYRVYADYATGKDRSRLLRKAKNAEKIAEKYAPQPVIALDELKETPKPREHGAERGLRRDLVYPECVYEIVELSGRNLLVKLCVEPSAELDAVDTFLGAYRKTADNSGTIHANTPEGEIPAGFYMPRKDEKRGSARIKSSRAARQ